MQSIGEILPTVIEHMAESEIDFIKRKAAEYADMFICNGSFAAAYQRDYDNKVFTDNQAYTIVRLTDVYIAVKDGTYTRSQGVEKQKEVLKDYFQPPSAKAQK